MNRLPRLQRMNLSVSGDRSLWALAACLLLCAVLIFGLSSVIGGYRGRDAQRSTAQQLADLSTTSKRQRAELDCRSRVSKDVTIPQANLVLSISEAVIESFNGESHKPSAITQEHIRTSAKQLRAGLAVLRSVEVDCAAEARRLFPS